ncbi:MULTISPECIES: hypothetical protein [unclassified Pseudomonas]|uniref:hypothetical protein n=1 Tax=unclassified Pseudomonas TaxID=196821 RepID=UPI000CD32663|nr:MULTISPECIES: hypothetical protein [unclassified Pseudomonas]POA11970.1 hypothetical protein C1892_23615 [Pseudomonas sp. MPBD7-1]
MNSIFKQAELSRRAVLEKKYGKSGGPLANPPAVTITAQTLPNDLRIPVAALDAPLRYTIPRPSEPEDPDDLIEFKIRKKGEAGWQDIEEFLELGAIADREWPLSRFMPMEYLTEDRVPETPTEYEVQYIYWYGGTNEGLSDITTYAIDRTPPYRVKEPPSNRSPQAAAFPADLGPNDPIDEAYIGNNPNGITIKVGSYNYHATDTIKVFWGVAPDVNRDEPAYEGPLPSSYEVLVPIRVFVESDEGVNTLRYVVTDLAGNISKPSDPSYREIKRIPDPTVFPAPVVPLANGEDGDDLIDLRDCNEGVDIIVEVPTPNVPTDTVMAYWGSEPLGEKRVQESVDGKLTWRNVDFEIIKRVYGDTDGDELTNISYQMFRGTPKGGSDVDIKVNIFYVGPENPDEPSPINPRMTAPTLETLKGSIDEVLESDFGDPATIKIDLFSAPPTQEGWLIDVFYDDVKVGDTIRLTNGQEGTQLTPALPWQTILDQGSGTKVLRWSLYTATNPNPMGSLPKDVQVEEFPIQTPMPEVLNLAGPLKRIGCSTLNFGASGDGTPRRNLQVRIPKSSYTVDGETVTLSWAAYTNEIPPILIPGTGTTVDLNISGTFPDAGEVIEIGTYETHFKPANRGNGRLSYTITRTGTTPTPPSAEAEHYVLVTNSEAQYCEDVNPGP